MFLCKIGIECSFGTLKRIVEHVSKVGVGGNGEDAGSGCSVNVLFIVVGSVGFVLVLCAVLILSRRLSFSSTSFTACMVGALLRCSGRQLNILEYKPVALHLVPGRSQCGQMLMECFLLINVAHEEGFKFFDLQWNRVSITAAYSDLKSHRKQQKYDVNGKWYLKVEIGEGKRGKEREWEE
jgi:hypothetical protein